MNKLAAKEGCARCPWRQTNECKERRSEIRVCDFFRGIRVCDKVDVALAGRMLGDELEPVG